MPTLKTMTIDEYQIWTRSTAVYPGADTGDDREKTYLVLGLNDEAGEVAGKRKKILRGDPGAKATEKEDMRAELGDVMYYLARSADAYDITMTELMEDNYSKLEDRKSRDQLKGSGDKR